MISTVSSSQLEILQGILALYCHQGFDCDPTYSKGSFYKGLPVPRLRFDLCPVVPGVVQADCRRLPLPDESVMSIVFDPPFIHAHGKDSQIGNRFSSYKSQREIYALYRASIYEFARVMKPGGILVFKCQDIVESGKQVWNHIHVFNLAREAGFVAEDLFVLTAKSRLIGWNQKVQKHARKFHSYFWVFRFGKGDSV
jgi:hypothetical protein